MNHHARRILTPGASRKRKESEAPYLPAPPSAAGKIMSPPMKGAEPVNSNQLLAGYMAYEFLTKGTLLGQKWDPARAEAVPVAGEPKRMKPGPSKIVEAEPSRRMKQMGERQESYGEVARLLKGDGAHVPGIVNPTQLARWIQM